MKLILTAMALTIAAAIAAPVAAQAGPTSPPHAAVPHGGAVTPATPATDPHAGHAQGQGQPAGGTEHRADMACCHHQAAEGANSHAESGCCCCRHGEGHGAEGAPADAGADHGAHAQHGG